MNKKSEVDLKDILQIINRRRKYLILPIILTLFLAVLYNYFTKPIYESSVLLKKENASERRLSRDEFEKRFSLQTTDEIETEIELINTRTVLEKVINGLNLSVTIKEYKSADGESKDFDIPLKEYELYIQDNALPENLPQFKNFKILAPYFGREYYLLKSGRRSFQIYESKTEKLLKTVPISPEIYLPEMQFLIYWPDAKVGDKVYFKISDFESTLNSLRKKITIDRSRKETSIFSLTVQSQYPRLAQLLANNIADKYRESRLEQKRQTVHYSTEFVDNQLQEISKKLKEAEQRLSKFKSEQKIAIMDESSRDLIKALSELESEKVKTDLDLSQYQNKLKELGEEVKERGFFDQSLMSPVEGSDRNSPFAELMGQLSDAELKRLELLQKRKETHPDVINLDNQIAQIRARLAEYNQNTLTSYRIIVNSLRRKQYNLRRFIQNYGARIQELPGQEAELVEMTREKNVHEKMYNLLINKREELRVAEFSELQDIIIIDSARLPYKPVAPLISLNLIFGGLLGLLIGIVSVFIQEFFDKKISTIDDFEKQHPFPLLAILPEFDKKLKNKIDKAKELENRLVVLMEDQLAFRESYRVLRTRLLHLFNEDKKILMFTSCEENTGKTTLVANFAMTLARTGKKILIIDCDLRKSAMANFLNVPSVSPGLLQFLTNNFKAPPIYKPIVIEKSNTQVINFIPAGGCVENSSELLESHKLNELLKTISPQYDFILIDTPPITRIVDTLVLGKYVKDVVLVVRPNLTFKGSLATGIEELEQSNMNLIGFVLNAGDVSKMSDKYKYGYGYGYGYEHGSDSVGKAAK